MGTRVRTARSTKIDHRRFLEERLASARARIKGSDIVSGVVLAGVGWICFILTAIVLDQFLELPATFRLALLAGATIATAAVIVVRVILPAWWRIDPRFAAQQVESADRTMKNSVLSWVELREEEEAIAEPILRTIESRAASDLAKVRIEDAIQPKYVLNAMYALAAVVVLFCIYSFFTTKSFATSFQRILLPMAGVAPPTSTQLRIVFDPGLGDGSEPAPLASGSSITFRAAVVRGEPTTINAYLRADGSDFEEPHELSPTSHPKEFTLTLPRRQRSFSVRFTADDYRSPVYSIPVTPAPMITDWLVHYEPPAYTGEAPFTSPTPDIDGLVGTLIRIEATANLPVDATSAQLEIRTGAEKLLPMQGVEGQSQKLTTEFKLDEDGSYSVFFRDRKGRSPEFRPNHQIRVRPDLAPKIEFLEPREPEIQLPAGAPLKINARISDDFGLRLAELTVRRVDREEGSIERGIGRPGDDLGRDQAFDETLDLASLKLKPGDQLEYWIEAEDNKLPVANRQSTQDDRRTVLIVEPPPARNEQSDPKASDQNSGDKQGNEQSSEKNQQQSSEGNEQNQDPQAREGDSGKETGTPQEGTQQEGDQNAPSGDSTSSDNNGSEQDQSSSPSDANRNTDNARDSSTGDRGNDRQEGSSAEKSDAESKGQQDREGEASDSSNADPSQSNSGQERSSQQGSRNQEGDSSQREALTEKDRQALERLQKYFDEQSKDEANEPSDPKRSERSNTENQDAQGESQESNKSESSPTGDQADNDSAKAEEEGSTQTKPAGSASEEESQEPNAAREADASGKEQQGDASNLADQQKNTAPDTDRSGSENPMNKGDSSEQSSSQGNEPGSEPSEPQPAQDSTDGPPKPASEGESQESADPSHKTGPEESDSSPVGNSEGESSPGDSSNAGQSDAGSPTDEQGNQPGSEKDKQSSSANEGDQQKSSASEGGKQDSPSSQGGQQEPPSTDPPEEKQGSQEASQQQNGKPSPAEGKSGSEESTKQKPSQPSGSSELSDGQQQTESQASEGQPSSKQQQSESAKPSSSRPEGDPSSSQNPGQPASGEPTGEAKQPATSSDAPGHHDGDPTQGEWSEGTPGENDNLGDQANPDDQKKATNLVLKRLEEQLAEKKVDPELLKSMGWTEEDARQFANRLKEAESTPEFDPLNRSTRQSFGEGNELRKSTGTGAGSSSDQIQELFSGRRTPVPSAVRKRFEAYTRSLSGAEPESAPAKP